MDYVSNLKILTKLEIKLIDDALVSLGDFGEARIVVQQGKIWFLEVQESIDIAKVKYEKEIRGEEN